MSNQTTRSDLSAGTDREELLRQQDQLTFDTARKSGHRWRLLWLLIGPGILVMLGENDGPSMMSYATTGATYGIGFFVPFILLTFAMAFVVQEMTLRIGIASQRGHARLIFERFGYFWGYFAVADLVFGNLLTLVTEFIAIQAGGRFFGIAPWLSVTFGILIVVSSWIFTRYSTWERLVLLLAVGNLCFIPAAFFAHPDVWEIAASIKTWSPLPGGITTNFVMLILANIGATITPWMVFFQQSTVVDKGLTRKDLPQGRVDTALGAVIAAIVAISALVATAPLFQNHIDIGSFSSGADFATALSPYLGDIGATLFAVGILEAGLLAAATISTTSSYALSELISAPHSLNLKFRHGLLFYGVALVSLLVAGAIVLIPDAPLVTLTLVVNVIATLLMGPVLLFLLLLANDHEIMGDLANGWLANATGGLIIIGISFLGCIYGLVTIFPNLLSLG